MKDETVATEAALAHLAAELASTRRSLDLLLAAVMSIGGTGFLNTMLLLRLADGGRPNDEELAVFARTAQESFGKVLQSWSASRGEGAAAEPGSLSDLPSWLQASLRSTKGES